jgi:hypothetical protein
MATTIMGVVRSILILLAAVVCYGANGVLTPDKDCSCKWEEENPQPSIIVAASQCRVAKVKGLLEGRVPASALSSNSLVSNAV